MRYTMVLGFDIDAVDNHFIGPSEDSQNSCYFALISTCANFNSISSRDLPIIKRDLLRFVNFRLEREAKHAFHHKAGE